MTIHEILVNVLSMQFARSILSIFLTRYTSILCRFAWKTMINNSQTSDKNGGSNTHWIYEVIMCALYRGFDLFPLGTNLEVLHHFSSLLA